jgi:hypothetical protein
MPVVVFLFVKIVMESIRAFVRKGRAVRPQPLCVDCSYAHVQYGTSGKRAISCTYGGMCVRLRWMCCTARTIAIATSKFGQCGLDLRQRVRKARPRDR